MKSVIISIRPKYCKMIASGEKTLEIRRSKPTIPTPFKCYIYCTAGSGGNTFNVPVSAEQIARHYEETGSMVSLNCPIGNQRIIGEFICDEIRTVTASDFIVLEDALNAIDGSCLSPREVKSYAGWNPGTHILHCKDIYGWKISDLRIYENPKGLGEFRQCHKCQYGDFENCYQHEHSCDGAYLMKRPPQSWCYVTEA